MIEGALSDAEGNASTESCVTGISGSAGRYEGVARVVRTVDDLFDLEPGDVLVAPCTAESFNSFLHLVGAIVTDHGGVASHAAIMGRDIGIPTVVGTGVGTRTIRTGSRVVVDGTLGLVEVVSAAPFAG